jgi:ABC-2 type transport system permease protein
VRGFTAVLLTDLKRFWLDRVRFVSGLIQPLLYLFVLGAGLGGSSQLGGAGYQRYIFPGVIALTLLFSATFSAIFIVFDRQVGFLKAVLVAPVSRTAIAVGKIASGAAQAGLQAVILLVFAPAVGLRPAPLELALLVGAMLLSAVTFSALGVAVAARFTSTTVFPIVSNAVLLPLYFLSGALYPLANAPVWMQRLVYLDPVAYAVDLMRGALIHRYYFAPWLSLAVLAGVTAVLAWLAVRVFQRGEDTELGPVRFH